MSSHAHVGSLQCAMGTMIRYQVLANVECSAFRDPEMERLKVAHLKQNQVVLELQ